MKSLLDKYPRMTAILLGFLMGLVVTFASVGSSDKLVKTLQTSLEKEQELRRTLEVTTSSKIEKLTEENKKLKSKTTTYKIIKPDGTIEEKTSSEVESEETISASVRSEYESKLTEQVEMRLSEYEYRLEKVISERKALRVNVGKTTKFDWYGSASYSVLPPLTIQFWGTQSGELGLGMGIDL